MHRGNNTPVNDYASILRTPEAVISNNASIPTHTNTNAPSSQGKTYPMASLQVGFSGRNHIHIHINGK